ncbi:MAG: glycoside hydrolase family 13 [Verrucomicrobia bacterium 12-59-8]|nr:MAG: glycoside hydrolase family 13 [Verrucomicrobia bacterium 12-59-8]
MKTHDEGTDEELKPVDFSCHAPKAQAVFVAGTFNDWRPDTTPLIKDDSGTWKVSLKLPAGHHEFKFIVDGQWCCEPGCESAHRGCPKCVPNDFGTMNRVLEVG